jgi:hypothetical protein
VVFNHFDRNSYILYYKVYIPTFSKPPVPRNHITGLETFFQITLVDGVAEMCLLIFFLSGAKAGVGKCPN